MKRGNITMMCPRCYNLIDSKKEKILYPGAGYLLKTSCKKCGYVFGYTSVSKEAKISKNNNARLFNDE